MTLGYFTSPAFGLAQMAAGRATTTAQKMRRDRIKSGLRSAYAPQDPMNYMGGRIGLIGDMPMEPLPPTGAYAAGAGLDRMAGERGGVGYSSQYGYQPTGHTAFDGGLMAQPTAAQQWRDRNPVAGFAGYKPRVGSERRVYSMHDDIQTPALKRMRAGMSLNTQEQQALSGMAPDKLAAALKGSYGERKAAAKETVRQRGLARGAARAAAREYRSLVQGGVPEPVASAMLMGAGGGVGMDPIAASLAGLLPPQAAADIYQANLQAGLGRDEIGLRGELGRGQLAQQQAEMNQRGELGRAELAGRQAELRQRGRLGRQEIRQRGELGQGELALGRDRLNFDREQADRSGQKDTLMAAITASENPIPEVAKWGFSRLKELLGGGEETNQGVTFSESGEVQFSPEDQFMLNNLKGNISGIEGFAKSRGWSDAVTQAAIKMFRGRTPQLPQIPRSQYGIHGPYYRSY